MRATAGRTAGAAVSQRRLDVIPAVRRRVAVAMARWLRAVALICMPVVGSGLDQRLAVGTGLDQMLRSADRFCAWHPLVCRQDMF